MKLLRFFLLLFSISIVCNQVNAQTINAGYNISELETIYDEITLSNLKTVLAKKGFKLDEHDIEDEVYVFTKADNTALFVHYEGKKITEISFSGTKTHYLKAVGELAKKRYLKYASEGNSTLFKRGKYFLGIHPDQEMITMYTIAEADLPSNIKLIADDGYIIDELHELVDILTLANYQSVLEQRGMKLERNEIEAGRIVFKKNDDIKLYINLKAGTLSSVHFLLSPESFKKAVAVIPGNSDFVKSGEEPSGTSTLIRYKYKGHNLSTNNNYFRITMWPNATSNASTINVSETYYSAKQIADAMNQKMFKAIIGNEGSSYKFEVFGSMNLDKRSIRFIDKNGILYLQVNIPRNGQCDYGLKEFIAEYGGTTGWGDDYFYLIFAFDYECSNTLYKSLNVHFKSSSTFTKDGVENWINKNANFKR